MAKSNSKKGINFGGIIVGLVFLGLSALFINWYRTDSSSGVGQDILLFGAIGIFFIYQSFKGKTTSSIFRTDVSGVVGVSPKTNYWAVLGWYMLAVIAIVASVFIFMLFLLRPTSANSWQNKIACLINYKCIKIEEIESNNLQLHTKDTARYTSDSYGFFLDFPQTWLVEYKKNTTVCNQQGKPCWEFKISNKTIDSHPSNLQAPTTIYLEVYPSYLERSLGYSWIDDYISKILLENKEDLILTEQKNPPKWFMYHLSKNDSTFTPHYILWANKNAYRIWFGGETSQEEQDKIMKYITTLSYFY